MPGGKINHGFYRSAVFSDIWKRMLQLWASMTDAEKENEYERLVLGIVKGSLDAWDDLLCMMPVICAEISDKKLVELIAFIVRWFKFPMGHSLATLVKSCRYIVARKLPKNVMLSVVSLIENILVFSGAWVLREVLDFADHLKNSFDETNSEAAFALLVNLLERDVEPEASGVILRFLARLSPLLNDDAIDLLVSSIRSMRTSEIPFVKICAIDSVCDINHEKQDLIADIIVKPIIGERCVAAKCHSLRVIADTRSPLTESHINEILKLKGHKSWKVKQALLETSLLRKDSPLLKRHFMEQCKSQDMFMRKAALDLLLEDKFTPDEVKPVIDQCLRNAHDDIILRGLRLLAQYEDLITPENMSEFYPLCNHMSHDVRKHVFFVIFSRIDEIQGFDNVVREWILEKLECEDWRDVVDGLNLILLMKEHQTHTNLLPCFEDQLISLSHDARKVVRDIVCNISPPQ